MEVAEGFYPDLWNDYCDRELLPQDSRAFIEFLCIHLSKCLWMKSTMQVQNINS